MTIDLEKIKKKYPEHKFEIATDCLFCDNKAILNEIGLMIANEDLVDKLIEVGVEKVKIMQKGFSFIPKRPTKNLE